MFTGFYNTKNERFENLIYNICGFTFSILLVMKLLGLITNSWVFIFAPLLIPFVLALTILVSIKAFGLLYKGIELAYVQISKINLFK